VQPSVIAGVPVGSGDEEVRDLIEGKSEPLPALITRTTRTVAGGYSRCPPKVRSGSKIRPRRS